MVIVAVGDGFRQFVKCRFFVLMITIAVRTLNEQIISLAGDDRIMHQERARTPQIPREDDTGRFAVFRYGQLQESGAEDMAGVLIGDGNARMGFEGFVVFHQTELIRDFTGVFNRVQRYDLFAFAVLSGVPLLLLLPPFSFHFLNMRAVLKHQPGKGRCRWRAVNGAFEPLMHNAGQEAGMIDMSVCQKDKINIS